MPRPDRPARRSVRRPAALPVIVAAVLALVAAACGGGGIGSGDDASGATGGVVAPSDDAGQRAAVDASAPVDELVSGFGDAGFDLLRTQPVDTNVVFSPLSIGHALLMARAAADADTGAAIDTTFGLPPGMAAHDAWNALDAALIAGNGAAIAIDESPTPVIAVADRLWPATTAFPDQSWIDLMATHHGADVETIDVTDGEGSRQRINEWVAEETNQLIPQLLPAGFIDDNTVLVLTDTVYFKAQWAYTFGKYGPEDGVFTRLDGSTVDVAYMVELEQPGPRGVGDGFVGAELPYLGDDYSMLIIVPDEGRFDDVRGRMSSAFLAEVDGAFTTGPYELRLPKWETTTSIDLLGWLADAGIAPGAFPGIGSGVELGGAVHGADIAVDEVGTEAAAATALGFNESGPPEPELVVAAERPFLYVIRHVDSSAVLFAGQVTDPSG
ncbi:MAG: serpin family protein [Actinomycetota bacterium]